MRPAVLVGLTLVFALACSRTPPEPAPSATVEPRKAVSPQSSPAAASGRCITPVASSAPAIPPPATRCPPDPEPNSKMPMGEVTFEDPKIGRLEVELAKTPHDVQRGLMFRRSMSDDHGMLFKLEGRKDQTFWMQNTCIPLDMLFIDDDGTIVGIVEGAAPLTETPRSVGCPSVFVLEVNGGWTRKRNVQPGQKVNIPFSAR